MVAWVVGEGDVYGGKSGNENEGVEKDVGGNGIKVELLILKH